MRGEPNGILVVDDYGHHPTEIAAVLEAARSIGRRIVVAFQPHRFTRTAALMDAFGPALAGADHIVLTDIYAAGEDRIPGVTVDALADAVRRSVTAPVEVVASLDQVVPAIVRIARPGDLVITLGAGSIGTLPDQLIAALEGTSMSAVAAPADRRFRRSHVKPSRTRRRWAGRVKPLLRYALAAIAVGVRRLPRIEQRRARARAESRSHPRARQRTAVAGRGAGGVERIARRKPGLDRPGSLAPAPAGVALGARCVAPALAAVNGGSGRVGAAADRASARIDDDMYLVDERGTIIDQYGPQYAGPRPADRRRPRAARLQTQATDGSGPRIRDRPRTRGPGRAGHRRAQGQAGHRADGCRRSTYRICTTRKSSWRRRRGHFARRRISFSRGSKAISISRRRCTIASPRSTMSTSGSTTGSTCDRRSGNPEAEWHEKNGTWWGSTSAPRR